MFLRIQILFLSSVFSVNVFACSFMQMLQPFEVVDGSGAAPDNPSFSVKKVHRGKDDGNFASCSDAGIITLKLDPEQNAGMGYIFEIVEGEFEDQLFTGEPITATEHYAKDGLYKFLWLDGSSDEQEPINIVVKIQAVSKTGEKSSPQLLNVSHPGVKKPWWKVW